MDVLNIDYWDKIGALIHVNVGESVSGRNLAKLIGQSSNGFDSREQAPRRKTTSSLSSDPDAKIFHSLSNASAVMNESGVSSHFFLLAFMNRKFKQEFVEHVLYGKFNAKKFSDRIRGVFASASPRSSTVEIQVRTIATRNFQQESSPGMLLLSFGQGPFLTRGIFAEFCRVPVADAFPSELRREWLIRLYLQPRE